ncbi:Uncharacterised protein [Mycobacteroides abscessus subsp. abscessus]|nr:Uncharacterised protein [Mycobacteroides abscessus subsp. abscessus]
MTQQRINSQVQTLKVAQSWSVIKRLALRHSYVVRL